MRGVAIENITDTAVPCNFKVGAFLLGFYHFSRNIPEVQSCRSEMRCSNWNNHCSAITHNQPVQPSSSEMLEQLFLQPTWSAKSCQLCWIELSLWTAYWAAWTTRMVGGVRTQFWFVLNCKSYKFHPCLALILRSPNSPNLSLFVHMPAGVLGVHPSPRLDPMAVKSQHE